MRYATILSPQRYVRALQGAKPGDYRFPYTPATVDEVVVEQDAEIAETLMMGLRLTQEGILRSDFIARFGVDLVDLHAPVIQKYTRYGLLEVDSRRVRLTQQGRLLSNTVFRELV